MEPAIEAPPQCPEKWKKAALEQVHRADRIIAACGSEARLCGSTNRGFLATIQIAEDGHVSGIETQSAAGLPQPFENCVVEALTPLVFAAPGPGCGGATLSVRTWQSVSESLRSSTGARRPSPGGLEKNVIAEVIRTGNSAIQSCYQRLLESTAPDLPEGMITTRFTIGTTGSVTNGVIFTSTLPDAFMEACVLDRMLRLNFPSPKGGGSVFITFPYIFKAPE